MALTHGETVPFITLHYTSQPVFPVGCQEKLMKSQLKDLRDYVSQNTIQLNLFQLTHCSICAEEASTDGE